MKVLSYNFVWFCHKLRIPCACTKVSVWCNWCDLRVTLLGTYVFNKTVTVHRHENKCPLVVNILSAIQQHSLSPNENINHRLTFHSSSKRFGDEICQRNVTISLQQPCTALPCVKIKFLWGQLKCETVWNRITCKSLLCYQDTDKLTPSVSSITNKRHAVFNIQEFKVRCILPFPISPIVIYVIYLAESSCRFLFPQTMG